MCRFLEDTARRAGIPITADLPDLDRWDLVVIVDVCDWDHMGALGEHLRASRVPRVCLDHHAPRSDIAPLMLVDPTASATGEIIYRYLHACGARIDADMANALYAALLFDTGCFRLSNTRDDTILLASRLVSLGASHTVVCSRLFENESYERMELLRVALGNLVAECGGRLAWASIDGSHFRRTGTRFNDGDGILDQLVVISGLEVGVLFRERAGEGIKVTFRSKGGVDVSEIAHSLGGGGRFTASGVLLPLPMREAMEAVLPPVREALNGSLVEQL
jgi:phosphoesterase RecJ-like protein